MGKIHNKKFIAGFAVIILCVSFLFSACSNSETTTGEVKLSKDNPTRISIWHYYNSSQKDAFDKIVADFNKTFGSDKGIIVEAFNAGNVNEVYQKVVESAQNKVGAQEMPNIFTAYSDTVYEIDKLGLVAGLDKYFTQKEIEEFVPGYIQEGKIGANSEFKIFPVAKATEVLVLNTTDWEPFAKEKKIGTDSLETIEKLVETSKKYYEWTDAQTPDVLNDGKAFFGRDAMANYMTIGSIQLGKELFEVSQTGKVIFNIDEKVMRKLWDCFYVPYINGYFVSNGKYSSDDVKLGDIIALVGSTTSASFFPTEITNAKGETHQIGAKAFVAPCFEDARKYAVQQGAGMAVKKSTPEEEYASVEFLKWFTKPENNIWFSISAHYLPVKNESAVMSELEKALSTEGQNFDEITKQTLRVGYETVLANELYTNRPFEKCFDARAVLEKSLLNKAKEDREKIISLLGEETDRQTAVNTFNTEENFKKWLSDFSTALEQTQKEG